jgi:hypothetical protein
MLPACRFISHDAQSFCRKTLQLARAGVAYPFDLMQLSFSGLIRALFHESRSNSVPASRPGS